MLCGTIAVCRCAVNYSETEGTHGEIVFFLFAVPDFKLLYSVLLETIVFLVRLQERKLCPCMRNG